MTRRLVHWLCTGALGPVLLAQGRRVRRVTPRLPEAAGAREGEVVPIGPARQGEAVLAEPACEARAVPAGDACDDAIAPATCGDAIAPADAARLVRPPRPLSLLIAGDSSAAGVGVAEQRDALAGLLPPRLAERLGRPVRWTLVARTGADAQDLAAMLAEAPARVFDAVVIAIGVNEVTARTPPARWRARLDALHALALERFGAPALLFSALPPMHRFPALPQPLRWYLGAHARTLDAELRAWALARPGTRHVPVMLGDPSARGRPADGLVAADGFHPGPLAYQRWAQALAEALAEAVAGSSSGASDPAG